MNKKDYPKLLDQKGLGKLLRIQTTLGVVQNHFAYVQICLTGENEYSVDFFTNPFLREYKEINLYKGTEKKKAEDTFNKMIEEERKIKEDAIHTSFSRN